MSDDNELLWEAFSALTEDMEDLKRRVRALEAQLDGNDAAHDQFKRLFGSVRAFIRKQQEHNDLAAEVIDALVDGDQEEASEEPT